MNKHLILGSEGLIGKALENYIINKNGYVDGIDIKNSHYQDLRYCGIDTSKYDFIYFLAWDVGGVKYLEEINQIVLLKNNMKILDNVMSQISNKNKILFTSSQLSNRDTAYGITKKLGECWTKQYDGIIVKFWNVYGYEPYNLKSHVIPDFVYQALKFNEIQMLTDGEEKRQFVYKDDIAELLYYIMMNEEGGMYDLTNNEWTKIIDIANIISKITGCNIVKGKKHNNEILNSPNFLYDWYYKTNLEDGIKKVIKETKNGFNSRI